MIHRSKILVLRLVVGFRPRGGGELKGAGCDFLFGFRLMCVGVIFCFRLVFLFRGGSIG